MSQFKRPRPEFPKRAVITAGMPYGNKSLHFGHIGGVFIHADTYARFLKDRIGKDNVIFVSGTDCYGSPILASYKKHMDETGENITMEDYVYNFHNIQKQILKDYDVAPSLYASSAFGRSGEVHKDVSNKVFETLHDNGFLKKLSTLQFYDEKENVYLNGRQVVGKCPFEGCASDKAYADECALGHQYMPSELLEPMSTLSQEKPVLKQVDNWYFILDEYTDYLKQMVARERKEKKVRPMVLNITDEFLKAPALYVTRKEFEKMNALELTLPMGELIDEPKKPSVTFEFKDLDARDEARAILDGHSIRYRTGKTLVPFRLSGNIQWGVPVPNCEGLDDLTFWVWPESLWAPISFTQTYLESVNASRDEWKKWWIDPETKVYQFIGEDNIYFYGVAEMGMLLAYLGHRPGDNGDVESVNFPQLVANCHLLFLDSKASSSSDIKPPMADELLEHYTKDQLRMHFLSLGLSKKSVSFNPKPFDPMAKEDEADVVLKDGNLLTNVFNRLMRSCFYTAQKYTSCRIPTGDVTVSVKEMIDKAVLDYEHNMAKQEFHLVTYTLDSLIRGLSKHWAKEMKHVDEMADDERNQVLVDMFYGVKVALTLLHPIVPSSCEFAREMLHLNESLWSWAFIFDNIQSHMDDKANHLIEAIPPKFDFFKKHDKQFENNEE